MKNMRVIAEKQEAATFNVSEIKQRVAGVYWNACRYRIQTSIIVDWKAHPPRLMFEGFLTCTLFVPFFRCILSQWTLRFLRNI